MNDYRKLSVWKKSIDLVKDVFTAVNDLPNNEQYTLGSQIKRSAISIPSNIAEGSGRSSDQQFAYHLNIALGSLFELETQVIILKELDYVGSELVDRLVDQIQEIIKMLIGLVRSLDIKKNKK